MSEPLTRSEQALAECDRRIKACEEAVWELVEDHDGAPYPAWMQQPIGMLAMLRIGRDVLTRHTPLKRHHVERCAHCYELWTCPDVQPWLDLLAPEGEQP